MKFTNKQYDVLKWIVITFLPALTALVAGLGAALSWADTELAVTVLALFTTFLGTLIGVSGLDYNKEDENK